MNKVLFAMLLSFSSLFAFEHLTVENFDEKVKGKKVVIDFYATWCPPCKIIAKNLTAYKDEKPSDVTIYKVDIDAQRPLQRRFNIRSIPTMVYMNNGKIVAKEVGIKSLDDIKNNVSAYLINK